MKACRRYRQPIVLLAAGVLSPEEGASVLHHLDQCSKCREHHQHATALCERQKKAADHLLSSPVPERLFANVRREICQAPVPKAISRPSQRPIWLPRAAYLSAMLGLTILVTRLCLVEPRTPSAHVVGHLTTSSSWLTASPIHNESSFGFYRKTVASSADDLDRLITQQAERAEGFTPTTRWTPGAVE